MNRLVLFVAAMLVILNKIFAEAPGEKRLNKRCFLENNFGLKVNRPAVCFFTLILFVNLSGIFTRMYSQWRPHVIDYKLNNPVTVFIANMDNDNKLDIVATGTQNDEVVWYKNNYSGWIKNTIDSKLDNPVGAHVADIDGDNDLDVVAAGYLSNQVVWYENNNLIWTNHTIDTNLNGAEIVCAGDIDGDNDLDVVATAFDAGQVVCYENNNLTWTKHIIDANLNGAFGLFVADIDGDDTLDVVAVGRLAHYVAWYENNHPTWTKHTIDANLNGAWGVCVADIDSDNDQDVLAVAWDSGQVVFYENNNQTWIKHIVDANLGGAYDVRVADINGDGKLDIVATGFFADNVVWYENKNLTWTKHTINANLNGATKVFIADIDDDNDQDVIAAGWFANSAIWYENPAPPYAHNFNINSTYSIPGVDTLWMTVTVENPEKHTLSVLAKLRNKEGVLLDSTSFFDDARHNDYHAGDGIWGSFWPVLPGELQYFIDIQTTDFNSGIIKSQRKISSFTTIGPVKFQNYKITSLDTFPNPGNTISLKLVLKNLSASVTVTKITAVLSCSDTSVVSIGAGNLNYNDILPGNTSTSSGIYVIKFAQNSPGGRPIPFKVDIFSDNCLYWSDYFSMFLYPTGIAENQTKEIPQEFVLEQNYPNPFNSQTIIEYQIPRAGHVRVAIYNLLGQRIITLVERKHQPGRFNLIWDGKDYRGKSAPSGVYFYRLETEDFSDMKKMLLLQ